MRVDPIISRMDFLTGPVRLPRDAIIVNTKAIQRTTIRTASARAEGHKLRATTRA